LDGIDDLVVEKDKESQFRKTPKVVALKKESLEGRPASTAGATPTTTTSVGRKTPTGTRTYTYTPAVTGPIKRPPSSASVHSVTGEL
jgi:hypothetical protein